MPPLKVIAVELFAESAIVTTGFGEPDTVVVTGSNIGSGLLETYLLEISQTRTVLDDPFATVFISKVSTFTAAVESDKALSTPVPSSITFNEDVRAAASEVFNNP